MKKKIIMASVLCLLGFASAFPSYAGWEQQGETWYYRDDASGQYKTDWQRIDGKWYFLSTKPETLGQMVTGYHWIGNKYFFLDPALGGAAATNVESNGFYFNYDGAATWMADGSQSFSKEESKEWWKGPLMTEATEYESAIYGENRLFKYNKNDPTGTGSDTQNSNSAGTQNNSTQNAALLSAANVSTEATANSAPQGDNGSANMCTISDEAETVARHASELGGLSVYGGDLNDKNYQGIEFSIKNLGVSKMALGSIINPPSNTATAKKILYYKYYYQNGTDSHWNTAAQKAQVDAFINEWKTSHISAGMSDTQKHKAIFDYMTSTITYDKNAANPQSSYGAFIERRSVCGGFANGYMTLAKACGLDVRYVFTSEHAFNLVKLDGKWYATDITWKIFDDASTTGIYYMHTTPEKDKSIAEKVAAVNQRNEEKPEKNEAWNSGKSDIGNQMISEGHVYNIDDPDIVGRMVNDIVSRIDTSKVSSQKVYCVLYTGGRKTYQEFNEKAKNYNGGVLRDQLDAELLKHHPGGKNIKDIRSNNIHNLMQYDFYKTSVRDGMGTANSPFQDDSGNPYVVVRFNITLK